MIFMGYHDPRAWPCHPLYCVPLLPHYL